MVKLYNILNEYEKVKSKGHIGANDMEMEYESYISLEHALPVTSSPATSLPATN